MVKDSTSNMDRKRRNRQPSLFRPPEEVCVIEDENGTAAQKLNNSLNSKMEDSSM